MPHCPRCGAETLVDATFCTKCGAPLGTVAPVAPTPSAPVGPTSLSNNLSNSFEYAKKLFGDFGRLVILIVLGLIPIVNWIVSGYAARTLRESPGADSPPKLEKYGDLFVDGAKIFFASLIYMLIPMILMGAGVGSFVASMATVGGPNFSLAGFTPVQFLALGGMGVVVLVVIGILVAFAMLILLAAGLAHMIKSNSFGKAFAFSQILRLIGRIGWGKYLAWITPAAIVAVVIGAGVGSIPYVGWVISAVIAPPVMVLFYRSLGILYSEGAA